VLSLNTDLTATFLLCRTPRTRPHSHYFHISPGRFAIESDVTQCRTDARRSGCGPMQAEGLVADNAVASVISSASNSQFLWRGPCGLSAVPVCGSLADPAAMRKLEEIFSID
jgi:hypothetical protein